MFSRPTYLLAGVVIAVVSFVASVTCHAQVAKATSGATNDPRELYIIFDKQPKQKGMSFDRTHVVPTDITVAGKHYEAWKAQGGSWSNLGYGRAFRFSLSDQSFKSGGQPAIDIEVEFWIPGRESVNLRCDTERGSQLVDQYWGTTPNWQKSVIHLNDAWFANRVEGSDLRLEGYNCDLYIRSIRIKGHDRDSNPDYGRMLRIPSITSDREILAFPRDGQHTLEYHLRNLARKAVDADYSLELTDRDGKRYAGKTGPLPIPAEGQPVLAFGFDTKGLKYGVYSVNLVLKRHGNGELLTQRESYIGVISDTQLPKAKPGEFYYGLDSGVDSLWRNPRITAWTKLMGVDILRSGVNFGEEAKSLPQVIAQEYEPHTALGLRIMPVLDPPKDEKPDQHASHLVRRVELAGTLAKLCPEIEYYELGNEPDLPFFYPGPIEQYSKDFTAMAQAIKQANPKAIVGTAGLSFAGQTATERARKFVQLTSPSVFDAWCYHGHGPGSKAERSAYTRMVATAKEFGKDNKTYIETESGVAAREKYQEDGQARTCIQKMVYAQAQHLPLFMWFRLLMFSEDYGNLRTEQEPRPVVLAYRAMVEALRGHAYTATVDLQKPETEAYVFNQIGGDGRAMVLWANEVANYNVYLALGPSADAVKNVRLFDMYGNPLPVDMLSGQTVRLRITENPVFLKWNSSQSSFAVTTSPAIIETASIASLAVNSDNPVSVTVRNPFDTTLEGIVSLQAEATAVASVTPASQKVSLSPHQEKPLTFSVKVGQCNDAISWPSIWTVFAGISDKLDLTQITGVPETLAGSTGTLTGRKLAVQDNRIDFEKAGGKMREKNPGVIFAEVESPVDQELTMGASADWWMAWFVNGKPVYDTLATGNGGGGSFLDHTFKIPLKAGKNLLAAKVLSGSQGWKILIGSPDQVKRARNTSEHLVVALADAKGKTLVSDTASIQYLQPIASPGSLTLTDPLAKWQQVDPTAVLDGACVTNFFYKEPDSSRWWKGEKDLSAQLWMRADSSRLYLLVKVTDDQYVANAKSPESMGQADSLQVGIAPPGKTTFNEYLIGQVAGKTTVFKQTSTSGAAKGVLDAASSEVAATVERDNQAGVTVYRLSFDRKLLGTGAFRINVLANDNDSSFLKQVVEWKPGMSDSKDPSKWYLGVLGK